MRSEILAMRSVFSLAIMFATVGPFQPAALVSIANAAEKPDVTAAFVKGSVWKGNEFTTKPKPSTTSWQLTVIRRDGETYFGQLASTSGLRKRIEGTIKKDGSFTWKGAPDEPSPGHPHEGKISGDTMVFKITPTGDGLESHGFFTRAAPGPGPCF